ncbi:ferredoxin:glutaredoxin reductase [Methanoplanus sp. FWC-SCC4]|uniref:ferredoxin:thioredoxin reductase n=1 Tax=Methanochimaera problematica TaxID=2609417 RepID=A0AA97FCD3_9EURY|nr:ferredoxin-thioredoxin reductase catalytic domain-containing protein [Methanoplanus sp. FWC-SCC4]WOF15917.1 ferredoxin:glutaredoxin reductase [Methanoplanus sp. FWC-SCC4]
MTDYVPDEDTINTGYLNLNQETKKSGYFLNPDINYVKELVKGLLINKNRYGCNSCPCRLFIGDKADNKDIICPCDYRDDDISEFGCCYCALYVSKSVLSGEKDLIQIPDRRYAKKEENTDTGLIKTGNLPYPVFRCRVCGYLCSRKNPPEKCPICGASSENFEKYI